MAHRPRMSITITEAVLSEIDARGEERSGVIDRDLGRYYEALRRTRRALRELLSEDELSLITDARNGTAMMDAGSVQMLAAEIEDSLEDGLADKWDVDGPDLVARLRGLPYIQCAALVDAVERHWERVGRGEQPPIAGVLA